MFQKLLLACPILCSLSAIAYMKCIRFECIDYLEKLVHAFISGKLAYYNGLFTCVSKKAIRQIQLIQNVAVRVLLPEEPPFCYDPPLARAQLGCNLKQMVTKLNPSP